MKMEILDKLFGKATTGSKTTQKHHASDYGSKTQEGNHYDKRRKEEENSRKGDDKGGKHEEVKAPIIGIDLGTSNSSVAVIDTKTGRPVTIPIRGNTTFAGKISPSCVAFTKDGEILIGDPAKRQAITNPVGTVMAIKRKIGTDYKVRIHGKEYTPQLIEAFILRKIKQDAEEFLGMPISHAVVSVPAHFNDCQRQTTKDACTVAGLDTVRFISEPTAAALTCESYEPERQESENIMVFHIGGGTVDVTIMNICEGVFEVLSTWGDTQLGGIDMDNRIIDYIVTEFKKKTGLYLKNDKVAMERLREAAETSKIELSSNTISNINLPYIAVDRSGSKDLDMTLTREKLEELVSPIIERLKLPINHALKDAKLSPMDVGMVILVGEPTHLPIIRDTIKKILGREIKYKILPKEYVAIGAAIQAGILAGQVKEEIVLLDVTPLTLSVETLGGVATSLIERNTTIPTKKSHIFTTAADNQTSVEIHITQGERPMAADNTSLGRFHLDGFPPAPRGVPQIEVTFDIDANGILNVTAKDKGAGKQDIAIKSAIKSSKGQIDKMREETERFAENYKMKREESEIRNTAESLIYTSERTLRDLGDKISKEQKEAIEKSINVLRKALKSNDLESIKIKAEGLKSAL